MVGVVGGNRGGGREKEREGERITKKKNKYLLVSSNLLIQ